MTSSAGPSSSSIRRKAWIYVSSTFGDMEAEIWLLETFVGPALRRRGLSHGLDIKVVVLFTPAAGISSPALEHRLQMIDQCLPFFISLLGERYGRPPLTLGTELVENHPWLLNLTDRSVLELEIFSAAFRKPVDDCRCFFYFRDATFLKDVPPGRRKQLESESPQAAERLRDLKERLRTSGHPVLENYACRWDAHEAQLVGLEVLARRIVEDLWSAIERTFLIEPKVPAQAPSVTPSAKPAPPAVVVPPPPPPPAQPAPPPAPVVAAPPSSPPKAAAPPARPPAPAASAAPVTPPPAPPPEPAKVTPPAPQPAAPPVMPKLPDLEMPRSLVQQIPPPPDLAEHLNLPMAALPSFLLSEPEEPEDAGPPAPEPAAPVKPASPPAARKPSPASPAPNMRKSAPLPPEKSPPARPPRPSASNTGQMPSAPATIDLRSQKAPAPATPDVASFVSPPASPSSRAGKFAQEPSPSRRPAVSKPPAAEQAPPPRKREQPSPAAPEGELEPDTDYLPEDVVKSVQDSVAVTLKLPPTYRRIEQPTGERLVLPTTDPRDAFVLESLTRWLEAVIRLQRSAHSAHEIHERAARVLCEAIGLDLGMVLLRRGKEWHLAGRYILDPSVSLRYSTTFLEKVVQDKQTVYQDLRSMKLSPDSALDIEAVVISPIFGTKDEVVGVLYGSRRREALGKGGIGLVEAKLVQLLAAAVSANLTCVEGLKQRIQFGQFFSQDLFDRLASEPSLLEGKQQMITVLSAQVRDFGPLLEQQDPIMTCRVLREIMERLSEQVARHGGVIVNYPPQGLVAMWNAPMPQPDHVVRAGDAALDMQRQMPELNERWKQFLLEGPLQLHIGISTGTAEVGNTGSSRRLSYGPRGPTVNLAHAMRELCARYKLPLLLNKEAWKLLPSTFATRRLGKVRLSLQPEPLVIYELFGKWATDHWKQLRQAYETALDFYEAQYWSRACEQLMPLLEHVEHEEEYDVPLLKLLRRSWECFELRPQRFDPVFDDLTEPR